jgi:hypothetical protein
MKPDYCIQNEGDCQICSLASDGLDCTNRKFQFEVGELASALMVNERAVRKMLNDAGADPRLDEYVVDPHEMVGRGLVIDLAAARQDRVSRILAVLLR